MVESKELKVEHVLMFVIAAFLLYHLVGNCGCANRGDGFSVGGTLLNFQGKLSTEEMSDKCDYHAPHYCPPDGAPPTYL